MKTLLVLAKTWLTTKILAFKIRVWNKFQEVGIVSEEVRAYTLIYNCGKMPTVFCALSAAKQLMREEGKILKIIDMDTGQCVVRRGDLKQSPLFRYKNYVMI